MSACYEVWDDATANRLGEFETLDEARALLRALLRESGAEAVSTLAVLACDDSGVTTILEGADFIAQLPAVD